MANLRDLRRRIKSVKNTAQITKAMQMVSATKMRRAQIQAFNSRPYTETIAQILGQLFNGQKETIHPLMESKASDKVMVVLVTSDKGLSGALNTNLFRALIAAPELKGKEVTFCTVGKKGREFVVRTDRNLEADFENHDKVKFADAVSLRKLVAPMFLSSNIGEAYILFPSFISTLRQEPKLTKLLPISADVILNTVKDIYSSSAPQNDSSRQFLFEPNIKSLIDYTLNHFLDTQIYQAMLESKASEHSARMMAMQNATDNAKEIVGDLTLTYNGVRQENITRELLEITSAGAALG